MPKNFQFSIFNFQLLLTFFLMAAPASAQLADTLGAMSVAQEMEGNAAQTATQEAPKPEAKPADGDTGQTTSATKPAAGGAGDILKNGWGGAGGDFSPIKLPLYIVLFLIWTATASWMNSDQERLKKEGREVLNAVYLGLFLGLGGALFFVPIFWVAFPVTFLLWLVPALVYVVKRNSTLPPHEKVLTGEHLYFLFAVMMNKIGVKIKVTKRMEYETGSPIEMEALGKGIDPKILQGRLLLARNAPGYNDFREHVFDAIDFHATSLMFEFSPQQTTIKHLVDGVWLSLPPVPRVIEKGKTKDAMEEMLESAKILAGVNPADRRSRQAGFFVALIGHGKKKVRYEAEFLSQGTQTGEAVMIQFTASKVPFKDLGQLGMRPEIQPKVLEILNAKQGLVVVAAPPANGLRSSIDVFSRVCDRFTRDVVNVEDANAPSEEIENIILARYDSTKGETPLTVLPDILFKEPHALFVRDMTNPEVMKLCCEQVDQHRLFITMFRAKDGVETILKFLALKTPPQLFVSKLSAVISQRLVRKLCPACKEPYQPAPQLLQQLGLRPDQAPQFFRCRTPLPEPEERKRGICPHCNGIGYKGRTAMFEVVTVSDSLRELILSNPNPAALRQQLQKERQGNFAQEGIFLLLKGETTVEEFSRAMKM